MSDQRSQEERQRDSDAQKKSDKQRGQQPIEKPGFAGGKPQAGTGSQTGGSEGGLGGG